MKEEIKACIFSQKFGRLDGKKQLDTADCGVFVQLDSLAIIDRRYWIALRGPAIIFQDVYKSK